MSYTVEMAIENTDTLALWYQEYHRADTLAEAYAIAQHAGDGIKAWIQKSTYYDELIGFSVCAYISEDGVGFISDGVDYYWCVED